MTIGYRHVAVGDVVVATDLVQHDLAGPGSWPNHSYDSLRRMFA